jgi:glycosyltransferase involved in cell wall biosynthesis
MEKLVHQRSRLLIKNGKPLKVGGYLSYQEAVALYINSDFLVIPSRIESIPLVFSDALQCSLPVITTPVGDMPRILNNFACGILADNTSAESIARAIKQAVYHKQTSFLPGIVLANKSFSIKAACETFLSAIGQVSKNS